MLENYFCSHSTKTKVIGNILAINTGETELAFDAIQSYAS